MASKEVKIYSDKRNFEETIYKDNSIKKSYFKEYQELNRNFNDEKFFLRSQDLNVLINPSNSYFRVEGKLQKLDGTKSDKNDNVTLTNNGFNLFSRAEHKIQNKIIETVDHSRYVTLVNNLVEFSDDYGKSAASNMFWFSDTNDAYDDQEFIQFQTFFRAPKEGENVGLNFNVYRNGN